jgi:hypothetical protein
MENLVIKSFLISALICGMVIGFLSGIIFFLSFYSYKVKLNIRTRLESEKYDKLHVVDKDADTRAEKRQVINYMPVNIDAPVLDTAGVPVVEERQKIAANLIDISSRGAAILSPYFVPKDIVILVSCAERKLSFSLQEAQVRDVTLTNAGIRIGVQFLRPLRIV